MDCDTTTHANGADRFAGVTALVADPMATAKALAKLFGEQSIAETGYGVEMDTGRGFVRLATDATIGDAHPGVTSHPAAERPIWHVLTVQVADIERTGSVLAANGVPMTRAGATIRIERPYTRGLVLEFVA